MNEDSVSLLANYDETVSQHSELFTVNSFRGFSIAMTKKITQWLDITGSGSVFPLHFTTLVDINGKETISPEPPRSLSLLGSFSFPYGVVIVGNEDGITSAKSSLMISPFLIGSLSAVSDLKTTFIAEGNTSFRQPWSNISLSYQTKNFGIPCPISFSGTIGSQNISAGIKYQPNFNKLYSFACAKSKRSMIHTDFSRESIVTKYQRIINDYVKIGTQITIYNNLKTSFEMAWLFKKDQNTQVHSIVSSQGIIASEFRKKVNQTTEISLTTKLDHIERYYTFGLGISLHSE